MYGSKGEELAKFRHFPYAYTATFKPNSNIIAVKSTEGFLGFYDLDSLSLIKKITVTRLGAPDEGFAFTPDGRYFCNIEKPVNSCQTQLGIYDGASFDKVNTLFADEQKTVLRSWNLMAAKRASHMCSALCAAISEECSAMALWENLILKTVRLQISAPLTKNGITIFAGINRGKGAALQKNRSNGIR